MQLAWGFVSFVWGSDAAVLSVAGKLYSTSQAGGIGVALLPEREEHRLGTPHFYPCLWPRQHLQAQVLSRVPTGRSQHRLGLCSSRTPTAWHLQPQTYCTLPLGARSWHLLIPFTQKEANILRD